MTGLDLSMNMLKIAEKNASAKQKIDLVIYWICPKREIRLVTCYSDSICYMQDEVEASLRRYNALNEDGVFIFDIAFDLPGG